MLYSYTGEREHNALTLSNSRSKHIAEILAKLDSKGKVESYVEHSTTVAWALYLVHSHIQMVSGRCVFLSSAMYFMLRVQASTF